MKGLFVAIFTIAFIVNSYCQSICQTGDENATLTLTAPPGMIFVSVSFASYGTPNGSCGSFSIGACHASNSQAIVEAALLGQNSASIAATNGTFGDPCGGTFKRLYIEAVYSVALPLELLSFSCFSSGDNNVLHWQTDNEVNTREFIIERMIEGSRFSEIGKVVSNNSNGKHEYFFTDNLLLNELSFYRLKMIDIDGRYQYSKIIRSKNGSGNRLQAAPNPAVNNISLNQLKPGGLIELTNIQGNVLRRINVTTQTFKIDLSSYPSGMYFIRYSYKNEITVQKILKR
jgi:hypothetical protein